MSSSTASPPANAVTNTTETRSRPHTGKSRLLIGMILFAVGLAMAGTGYWLDLPERLFGTEEGDHTLYTVKPVTLNVTIKEDGELKPVNSVEVKCEVQGQRVTIEWIIDESTQVNEGDLLVRLASDDIKERVEMEQMEVDRIAAALVEARQELEITRSENASRIDKAEVNLRIAELELQRYLHGDYEKTKKQIEINIANTEMNIRQKQDELDKSRPLVEKGFVTRSKIDELESSLEQLQMTLQKHQLELAILEEYELTKSEMQKRSAVDQARQELERERQRAASRERQAEEKVNNQQKTLALRQSRLERLKEQLAKCEIHAPIEGVVQYGESGGRGWRRGNRVAPGEQVYPGQTLVTIPDTSQMMVTTRIHEADRHQVTTGLPCLVNVPAVPGHTFSGKVAQIAQFADSERSWWNPELKEHATEILLEQTDAPLSPGDSAHVEILIDEVPDVLAVPVQCVYSRGPKRFVFVKQLASSEPVPIEVGHATATMVEVTEGLQAGDEVLMHVDERLLAKLPAPSTVQHDSPRKFSKRDQADSSDDESAEETASADQGTEAERAEANQGADEQTEASAAARDADTPRDS